MTIENVEDFKAILGLAKAGIKLARLLSEPGSGVKTISDSNHEVLVTVTDQAALLKILGVFHSFGHNPNYFDDLES